MKKTLFLFLLALVTLCSTAQTNRFRDSTVFFNSVNFATQGKSIYYKNGAVPGYVLTATDTFGKVEWSSAPVDTALTGVLDSGQTYTIGKNTVVNPGDFIGNIIIDSFGTTTTDGYISNFGYVINQTDAGGNQISISMDINRQAFTLLYDDTNSYRPQMVISPNAMYWERNGTHMIEVSTDTLGIGFFDVAPVPQPSITALQYASLSVGEQLIADALILLGLLKVTP